MRPIDGHSRVLGILGNPLGHSFSPIMHNAAIQSLGLNHVYVPLEVPKERIGEAVLGLRALNFLGANVTQPYKQSVIPYLDEISPLSEVLGAVNTIVNKNGRLWGTSTDGQGFIQSFHEHGFHFEGQSLAIFGTGGAARSILLSLVIEEKPGTIFLVGRNETKLNALAKECFEKTGRNIEAISLGDYNSIKKKCTIIVNTTPLGMEPNTNESILEPHQLEAGQIVYDIIYNPKETQLIQYAKSKGLSTVGGLGMLVHQGIASFEHWTGTKPDSKIYFDSFRELYGI